MVLNLMLIGLAVINTHTDQVIIWGSLVIGLWLIADGIYLIVT